MLVFPLGRLLLWWVRTFYADEPLQLPLPNKSFYLLLQVIIVGHIVTVITAKATVLISGPFTRISLQLARKCQFSFILDLHQDLIDWRNQRDEACEPPSWGFGAPILLWFPVLVVLRPLSCRASSCFSLFLGFSSRASSTSFAFMYLVAL